MFFDFPVYGNPTFSLYSGIYRSSWIAFAKSEPLSISIDFHHVCYQPITNKRKMFLPIFAIVVIHKDTCLMDFILLLLLVETPSDWNKLMSKFRFSCCMSHQICLWSSSVNDTGRKFLWLKLVKRKKSNSVRNSGEKARRKCGMIWEGIYCFICLHLFLE